MRWNPTVEPTPISPGIEGPAPAGPQVKGPVALSGSFRATNGTVRVVEKPDARQRDGFVLEKSVDDLTEDRRWSLGLRHREDDRGQVHLDSSRFRNSTEQARGPTKSLISTRPRDRAVHADLSWFQTIARCFVPGSELALARERKE